MKDDKKKKKVKRKEQDLWSGVTIDLSNVDSSDEDDRKEDNNMTDGKVCEVRGRRNICNKYGQREKKHNMAAHVDGEVIDLTTGNDDGVNVHARSGTVNSEGKGDQGRSRTINNTVTKYGMTERQKSKPTAVMAKEQGSDHQTGTHAAAMTSTTNSERGDYERKKKGWDNSNERTWYSMKANSGAVAFLTDTSERGVTAGKYTTGDALNPASGGHGEPKEDGLMEVTPGNRGRKMATKSPADVGFGSSGIMKTTGEERSSGRVNSESSFALKPRRIDFDSNETEGRISQDIGKLVQDGGAVAAAGIKNLFYNGISEGKTGAVNSSDQGPCLHVRAENLGETANLTAELPIDQTIMPVQVNKKNTTSGLDPFLQKCLAGSEVFATQQEEKWNKEAEVNRKFKEDFGAAKLNSVCREAMRELCSDYASTHKATEARNMDSKRMTGERGVEEEELDWALLLQTTVAKQSCIKRMAETISIKNAPDKPTNVLYPAPCKKPGEFTDEINDEVKDEQFENASLDKELADYDNEGAMFNRNTSSPKVQHNANDGAPTYPKGNDEDPSTPTQKTKLSWRVKAKFVQECIGRCGRGILVGDQIVRKMHVTSAGLKMCWGHENCEKPKMRDLEGEYETNTGELKVCARTTIEHEAAPSSPKKTTQVSHKKPQLTEEQMRRMEKMRLKARELRATGRQLNINLQNNTGETAADDGDSAAKTAKGREEKDNDDVITAAHGNGRRAEGAATQNLERGCVASKNPPNSGSIVNSTKAAMGKGVGGSGRAKDGIPYLGTPEANRTSTQKNCDDNDEAQYTKKDREQEGNSGSKVQRGIGDMNHGIVDVGRKPGESEGFKLSGLRRKAGKVRGEEDECGAARRKFDVTNQRQSNTNNSLSGAIGIKNREQKSYAARSKRDGKTSEDDNSYEDDSFMASEGTESGEEEGTSERDWNGSDEVDSTSSDEEHKEQDNSDENGRKESGLRRSKRNKHKNNNPGYNNGMISDENNSKFIDDYSSDDYEGDMYGSDDDDGVSINTNASNNSTNSEDRNKVLAKRNDSAVEGNGYGERGASNDEKAGGKSHDAKGSNITKAGSDDEEEQEAVGGGTNDIAHESTRRESDTSIMEDSNKHSNNVMESEVDMIEDRGEQYNNDNAKPSSRKVAYGRQTTLQQCQGFYETRSQNDNV